LSLSHKDNEERVFKLRGNHSITFTSRNGNKFGFLIGCIDQDFGKEIINK
jgi:hypothetical protein